MWFKKYDFKPLIYKCGLKSISSVNFVNTRTLVRLGKMHILLSISWRGALRLTELFSSPSILFLFSFNLPSPSFNFNIFSSLSSPYSSLSILPYTLLRRFFHCSSNILPNKQSVNLLFPPRVLVWPLQLLRVFSFPVWTSFIRCVIALYYYDYLFFLWNFDSEDSGVDSFCFI